MHGKNNCVRVLPAMLEHCVTLGDHDLGFVTETECGISQMISLSLSQVAVSV